MNTTRTLLAAAFLAAFALSAAAQDTQSWNKPTAPFRVMGPVHFVGTNELGAYLVTTPAGHVLVDGGLASELETFVTAISFDSGLNRTIVTVADDELTNPVTSVTFASPTTPDIDFEFSGLDDLLAFGNLNFNLSGIIDALVEPEDRTEPVRLINRT